MQILGLPEVQWPQRDSVSPKTPEVFGGWYAGQNLSSLPQQDRTAILAPSKGAGVQPPFILLYYFFFGTRTVFRIYLIQIRVSLLTKRREQKLRWATSWLCSRLDSLSENGEWTSDIKSIREFEGGTAFWMGVGGWSLTPLGTQKYMKAGESNLTENAC